MDTTPGGRQLLTLGVANKREFISCRARITRYSSPPRREDTPPQNKGVNAKTYQHYGIPHCESSAG